MYTIKEIKNNKIAVRCGSIEQANILEKENNGYGDLFKLAVWTKEIKCWGFQADDILPKGYKIINFEDIDFEKEHKYTEEEKMRLSAVQRAMQGDPVVVPSVKEFHDMCDDMINGKNHSVDINEKPSEKQTITFQEFLDEHADEVQGGLTIFTSKGSYLIEPEKEYTMAEAIKEGLDFEYSGESYVIDKMSNRIYGILRLDGEINAVIPVVWILEHQNEKVTIVKGT